VLDLTDPDGYLSASEASEVKDTAEAVISPLPLPGVEGSPLDPGDIWLVVIFACVNETSIWETCNEHDGTPCDDTVLAWLHTLNRGWLEVIANLQLSRLAMTILDAEQSRLHRQPLSRRPLRRARRTLLDGSERWHDHVPSILYSVRRFQRKTGDAGDDVRS